MGHSTPPDPYGDDCLTCWPAGKTPSRGYIAFEGIDDCYPDQSPPPQPYNGSIAVEQLIDYPCEYLFENGVWAVLYDAALFDGSWIKQKWAAGFFFSGWKPQNCQQSFDNELTCGIDGHYGANGNACIMWNTGPADHSIGSLLNAINMEPEAETKFELWPASSERVVVRFARKKDATNILILTEPTQL